MVTSKDEVIIMSKSFDKKIGNWLKSNRIKRNMTQSCVAEKMGNTKATISRWESGKRSISIEDFKEYCTVIGIKISDAMKDIESL